MSPCQTSILTTVVGSYPIPAWLAAMPSTPSLMDAILVVVRTQEMAGIDVVSDGEFSCFNVDHPETNGTPAVNWDAMPKFKVGDRVERIGVLAPEYTRDAGLSPLCRAQRVTKNPFLGIDRSLTCRHTPAYSCYPHGPFRSMEMDDVIERTTSRVPLGLQFHNEWVDSIPGGQLISTDITSRGSINFEEPDLVINAIRQAVDKVIPRRKN